MSPAAEVLVAILTITLSVFLVVGIILVIYLIKLTRDIRKVTDTAGRTVDAVQTAVARFSKLATPMFITNMVERIFKKGKKGE